MEEASWPIPTPCSQASQLQGQGWREGRGEGAASPTSSEEMPRVRAQQMARSPALPGLQLYHISETRGLLKKINSVLQKITDPIQPKVAEHRPQTTKRLSYPFSREKQHL